MAASPVESPTPTVEIAAGDGAALWIAVVSVGQSRGSLRPMLEQMKVESWEEDKVVVRCGPRVLGLAQRSIEAVTELFSKAAGRPLTVEIRSGEEIVPPPAATSSGSADQAARQPNPASLVREHPIVKRAVELFGAKIVKVNPRRGPEKPGGV